MKVLILANGELYEPDIMRERIRAEVFDLVIGVDGGSRHAVTLDVVIDVIIGDMDSLTGKDLRLFKGAESISYPAEKDETDLELALFYACEKGADSIVLAGVMGGRMDMSVSNVLLTAYDGFRSCRIELWHGKQTGWVIRPPGEKMPGKIGDTVSFIPLHGNASGITTIGFKYPLKDEELSVSPRGISNVIEDPEAGIRLSGGLLLAVHTPGETTER